MKFGKGEFQNIILELQVVKANSNSVELSWKPAIDNVGVKEYQVLRNGELINTVMGTSVVDKKLSSNTEYMYTVKAVDAAGNISRESEALVIKTTEEKPDTEAPTQPKVGTTTNSIDLMWSRSEDNTDVNHYIVSREVRDVMKEIGTANTTSFMDKDLQANTKYKYVASAVDTAGNESMKSDALTVSTQGQENSYEQWDAYKAYKKEDKVVHEGKVYEAVQSYQGNGDPNWIFALSLWKEVNK